jgi:hypothetical protein
MPTAVNDDVRRARACHSEGGAALHQPLPDRLAPTEESAFGLLVPIGEPQSRVIHLPKPCL